MRRISTGLLATALALCLTPSAFPYLGGEAALPLENGGFEEAAAAALPAGWTAQTGHGVQGVASSDDSVFHSGSRSLRIHNASPAAMTVVSAPIKLQVGQLYRLAGWIRTEGAFSDPTSRYPTAVPACLSMASFPLTNHSPTLGADSEWREIETLFIATKSSDRVRLHLGLNGTATGSAWFDDIRLEKVDDIREYIPPETVRWFGKAYRYDDRGWIFVHIEGEPFERGFQYGYLLPSEIVSYIKKLGVRQNEADPVAGWNTLRFETDSIFLREYDEEYLLEMKGIAAGAAKAGARYEGRALDLLDIVTLNSVVDIGQLHRALSVTPHSLTGQGFLAAEEELLVELEEHKCSAMVATGPATADGEIVFGQIFMWAGYTGVHWNVLCDLVPSSGHRLIYHTFPGGIHSGADFYINDAGIVIGETTVSQTPYEPDSTPQSNRIRKAAQYADSIDEVVEILEDGNNGMYTNDWPIADVKTGEAAIFLLGTHKSKLWRTGEDMSPFGTPGFLWANNNNRDPEVRKEYVAQPNDRPYDLIFSPWNRDVAFNAFYREHKGTIDSIAAVNLWATSPVNRAHACDGKITTSEMARQLVFLAHYGKVTLREKFPAPGNRIMPDLPEAIPHLSLGYSTPSPIFVNEKLQGLPESERVAAPRDTVSEKGGKEDDGEDSYDFGTRATFFTSDKRKLWRQTVYPRSARENWLVSGSAAYWRLLNGLDEEANKASRALAGSLAELNTRYLYTVSREEDLAAVETSRSYEAFGPYQIPRIKGTFLLHQLRLALGNELFLDLMNEVHDRFARKEITNEEFIALTNKVSGRDLDAFIRQWIERKGLPDPTPKVTVSPAGEDAWELTVEVMQAAPAYHLFTHVLIETAESLQIRPLEIVGQRATTFQLDEKPLRITLNALNDIPVPRGRYYTFANFIDDFHDTLIIYGSTRQIEANHTLALRWQETVANAYVEILPPLVKDAELSEEQARTHDLMVLGSPSDNSFLARIADRLPVTLGKNHFSWQGEEYASSDDGLFLALPNPYNPDRVLYLFLANSALQLHQMTHRFQRNLQSWAVFKGDEVVSRGYHPVERFVTDVQGNP